MKSCMKERDCDVTLNCKIFNSSSFLFVGVKQNLRCHHNETEGEEKTVATAKNKAVPPLVLVVDHTARRWIIDESFKIDIHLCVLG